VFYKCVTRGTRSRGACNVRRAREPLSQRHAACPPPAQPRDLCRAVGRGRARSATPICPVGCGASGPDRRPPAGPGIARPEAPSPQRYRQGLDKDQMVRRVGFEPTHPFGQGLLRAPRLPFRHRRTSGPKCKRAAARIRRAAAGRRRTCPCLPAGRGARARRSSPAESRAWQKPRAASARARSAASARRAGRR
jgi:hypothetical protein